MSDRTRLFPGTAASRLPNLVGQTIGDDTEQFLLKKVIGRGAWGIVYLAQSLAEGGREYAVKCIANDEDMPDMQRECHAKELENHFHCQFHIPGVLKIHTLLQDDDKGVLYIVTEYCPDGDLLDFVMKKKFVGNDALIRSAFVQILDTVEAMHNLGVYHRDLKPDNIMCKDDGQTFVLGDFGFATEEELLTDFGMGSEPFMSPDVLGGLHGDTLYFSAKHADLWALGVILMNLVCGCLPWTRACKEDPDFFNYAFRDPDYFFNNFPISYETNEILKSIFTLQAEHRASIKDIRRSILAVKTFTDDSDFGSSRTARNKTATDENECARLARLLFASVGEMLPDDYVYTQAMAAQIPVPLPDRWTPEHGRPALHPIYSGELYLPEDVTEDVPDLSYEDEVNNTDYDSDSDSEGPTTPQQAPVDGGDNIANLEDIDQIEALDLSDVSPLSAEIGTYAHIPATHQFLKGKEETANGSKGESLVNKSDHNGSDQDRLHDTTENMWRMTLGMS